MLQHRTQVEVMLAFVKCSKSNVPCLHWQSLHTYAARYMCCCAHLFWMHSRRAVSSLAATAVSLQQSRHDYRVDQAVFTILFCSDSTAASWGRHCWHTSHHSRDASRYAHFAAVVQIRIAHWETSGHAAIALPSWLSSKPSQLAYASFGSWHQALPETISWHLLLSKTGMHIQHEAPLRRHARSLGSRLSYAMPFMILLSTNRLFLAFGNSHALYSQDLSCTPQHEGCIAITHLTWPADNINRYTLHCQEFRMTEMHIYTAEPTPKTKKI